MFKSIKSNALKTLISVFKGTKASELSHKLQAKTFMSSFF